MLDLLLGDPLGTVVAFYILVFSAAELARNAVDAVAPLFLRVYLYEAIATMTMCLCVFENGFMLAYGYIPFFITVAVVLALGARFNRGAQVSPLASFESLYYGIGNTGTIFGILFSQLIAAVGAFILVGQIWLFSQDYLKFHREKVETITDCHISYKVPFTYVVLFEFVACAFLRVFVPLFSRTLPDMVRMVVIPAFVSGMITSSIYLLGAAGLNPVVASCRLIACGGIDKQWFVLLYWGISTAGFLFGAMVSRYLFPAQTKAKKTVEKKTEKPRLAPKGLKQKIEKRQKKKAD